MRTWSVPVAVRSLESLWEKCTFTGDLRREHQWHHRLESKQPRKEPWPHALQTCPAVSRTQMSGFTYWCYRRTYGRAACPTQLESGGPAVASFRPHLPRGPLRWWYLPIILPASSAPLPLGEWDADTYTSVFLRILTTLKPGAVNYVRHTELRSSPWLPTRELGSLWQLARSLCASVSSSVSGGDVSSYIKYEL